MKNTIDSKQKLIALAVAVNLALGANSVSWSAPGGSMDVVDGPYGQWFAGTGYSEYDEDDTYEYVGLWCAFQWNHVSTGPNSFGCGNSYLAVTAYPAAISKDSYSIWGNMNLNYVEGWSTHYADTVFDSTATSQITVGDYHDCDGDC